MEDRGTNWRWRLGLGFWGLGLLALWGLEVLVPAGAGESLPLRWARKAAEHPLRSALALGLFLRALRPVRDAPLGPLRRPDPPRSAPAGTDLE